MLGAGRYLLGVIELGLIVGFACLGANAARRRLVPGLAGVAGQLATAVLAVAGLLWLAQLLGTAGWFEAGPYLAAVVMVGGGTWTLLRGCRGGRGGRGQPVDCPQHPPFPHDRTRGEGADVPTLVALAIAAAAVIHFAAGVKLRLSTGMTGFDSTWYHGPFAAGFFQSGDTWGLHFIAPQFLAWFYPANSEALHAVGMLAFGRDVLSPLLNLGWFAGCLVAGWCIGRPYRVAPWSLALTAIALSVPALHDQAGEARNDVVGIFFLLSAVAFAVSLGRSKAPPPGSEKEQSNRGIEQGWGIALVGLAAGLTAGTKLNFLLPAAALVVGLGVIAPAGRRWRSFAVAGAAALLGGGYWYLRNLAHTGNPLPWVKHLGPITLPAPEQGLGGREAHSVLGYLADGSVWSDWLLPGLHHGLTPFWPLLLGLALAGLLLCLRSRAEPVLRLAAAVGLAAALAWLIAPTSASGPDGMPRGFESGLRYLAPALALGLALLPTAPALRGRLPIPTASRSHFFPHSRKKCDIGVGVVVVVLVLVGGFAIQRHYLRDRYANPTFTTPGLNAAFKWAQGVSDSRIATTSTRQYPLYGRDLSNRVDYIGEERPHGGFTAPTSCRRWRRLVDEGDYDYVVASRDRIEPGKPTYPPAARWTQAPGTTVVLRKPPTVVYKLRGKLTPSGCRR